jgi:hypothetical protein
VGKYFDKIRQHERMQPIETVKTQEMLKRQQPFDPIPTIQPSDRITWKGSDGKANNGVIEFLHSCPGEAWAFCSRSDGGWSAVNVKYIRKVEVSL